MQSNLTVCTHAAIWLGMLMMLQAPPGSVLVVEVAAQDNEGQGGGTQEHTAIIGDIIAYVLF